jgi:diphthamide biosynthesis protein 2
MRLCRKLEKQMYSEFLSGPSVSVRYLRLTTVSRQLNRTSIIASYLPLISRLRSMLARNHKKSYTITVGKLNPAKLGNFLEIECFVLVACPENSLVEAKVCQLVFHLKTADRFIVSVGFPATDCYTL